MNPRSGRRAAVSLAMVLAGCWGLPARGYHVVAPAEIALDWSDHGVNVADGVVAALNAHLYEDRGSVEIDVLNRSETPIGFKRASMSIVDADGNPILLTRCRYLPDVTARELRQGEHQGIGCEFRARLRVFSIGPHYEGAFSRLTVSQPGFTRAGEVLPLEVTLAWLESNH